MTDLTITTVGRQLIADMLAGTETATFTKIQTSSHDYTGVTLTGLTSLSDVEQTQAVSMVTRIDAATVQVLASINNEALASAYYIRAIGLFAEDSESNEVLFAVATDIANPHYMPLPSEYVTGISYKLNVTVDNAGAVTIVIDPAAAPTMAQVVTLSTKIDQVTDMVGTVEPTNTATAAHAVGEYFINSDGQLVKTTAAIAVGNTIATGTNTARTTIAEVMAQANAAISTLNSETSFETGDFTLTYHSGPYGENTDDGGIDSQENRYYKIGKLVVIYVEFKLSGTPSSSEMYAAYIGLPYICNSITIGSLRVKNDGKILSGLRTDIYNRSTIYFIAGDGTFPTSGQTIEGTVVYFTD